MSYFSIPGTAVIIFAFSACNAPEKPPNDFSMLNDTLNKRVQAIIAPEISAATVESREYFVQTKSKKYEVAVKITRFSPFEEEPEKRVSGIVRILDKKKQKTLQKLPLKLFYFIPDTAQNLKKYDLTENEIIKFEDYNFDGNEDIAILNGEIGPHFTSLYDIYLYDSLSKHFQKNKYYTKIIQYTDIGFTTDKTKKTFNVSEMLGAWGAYEYIYTIKNNRPSLIKEIKFEIISKDSSKITKKTRLNGKWRTVVRYEKDKN